MTLAKVECILDRLWAPMDLTEEPVSEVSFERTIGQTRLCQNTPKFYLSLANFGMLHQMGPTNLRGPEIVLLNFVCQSWLLFTGHRGSGPRFPNRFGWIDPEWNCWGRLVMG